MPAFAAKKNLRWLGIVMFAIGALSPVSGARAQGSGQINFATDSDGSSSTRDGIRDILRHRAEDGTPDSPDFARLLSFYEARNFAPAWSGDDTAQADAATATAAFEHAAEQGLRGADYSAPLSRWNGPPKAGRDAALYDVTLTSSFLRYASDVRSGRFVPKDVYKDVILPAQDFDSAGMLNAALSRGSLEALIADLPPPQLGYRGLVEALAHYRSIAQHGGWPVISGNAAIALDGPDSRRAMLIKRLAFEDPDLAEGADDENLQVAVLRFQQRHGLDDDGKVGPDMISELNVPAGVRAQQIVANMERWRWLPRSFERRYIRVNVPDQSVEFVRNGKVVLHSKVIIGRKNAQTPILRTAVVAVVANPPWDIPGDIAEKQIVPKLRQNPNYLALRKMVIANGGIQQVPGPDNVLGVLMLDSPNDFDVYLHDTGNRKNFELKTRELSNGCVRVDQIFPLASLAYSNGESDNESEITDAVATGQTQQLSLRDEMPLYLLYWTAWAPPGGSVDFRPDRYGRDRILLAKLAPPARKPATQRKPAPTKVSAR